MAITLVTGGALGGALNNGANVTIALPTLVSNDVVISWGGHFNRASSSTGPTQTGWTTILSNTTANPFFVAAYKVMGGTPDTSFVAYGSGNATDAAAYGVYCLRGVNVTAVVGSTAPFLRATAADPDCPAATSTVSNAWILALALSDVNDSAFTLPTNYTHTVIAAGNDTNDATVGGGTREIAVPGAENPGTFGSWASGAYLAMSVFINPEPPVPGNSATLTLAGVAGTFATGTMAKVRTDSLAGQAAAFALGVLYYPDGERLSEAGDTRITEDDITRITENYNPVNDVDVNLTGQAATFATGSALVVRTDSLTGQSIATATGTIRDTLAKAIAGVQAAFAQGTMEKVRTDSLTGQAASFATGRVVATVPRTLIGSAATFATGSLAKVRTDALSGQAVTAAQGSFAKTHTNALVGRAATFSAGIITYSAQQSNVTVTIAGSAATFATGIVAKTHTNALTGRAGTFATGTTFASRTDALVGNAATFATGALAKTRTNALVGRAATFVQGITVRTHTNAITGRAATFNTGILTPGASRMLTGRAGTFAVGIHAKTHTNALTGRAATFNAGIVQVAGDQNALLTGVIAQFATGVLTYSGPAPGPASGEAFYPVLRPRHRRRR